MERLARSGLMLALVLFTACTSGSAATRARTQGPTPTTTAPSPISTVPSAPGPTNSASPSAPNADIDTHIEVYGDCQSPSFEPVEIFLTCGDRNVRLENLRWESWTRTRATGIGTLVYNDCIPYFAIGHLHQIRDDRVILTAPVPDPGGQLVWSRLQAARYQPGYDTGPAHGAPYKL